MDTVHLLRLWSCSVQFEGLLEPLGKTKQQRVKWEIPQEGYLFQFEMGVGHLSTFLLFDANWLLTLPIIWYCWTLSSTHRARHALKYIVTAVEKAVAAMIIVRSHEQPSLCKSLMQEQALRED